MVVLMRYQTDCEVAALATALNITWEEAQKALDWRRLPKGLENPVFGNPINLYRALIGLGYWKQNITLTMLLNGTCTPRKTIVLVKKSFVQQHWVVWAGIDAFGNHLLLWGDNEKPVAKTPVEMRDLFCKSIPNCAFQPYKASAWRILWEKIKAFFGVKSE